MRWHGHFLPNPTLNAATSAVPTYDSGACLHERCHLFFAWTPRERSALQVQPGVAEVDLASAMMWSALALALHPHCKVCWFYLHHQEFVSLHDHIKRVSCHISAQKLGKKATFWRKKKDELLTVSPLLNGDEKGSTLQIKRRKEGKKHRVQTCLVMECLLPVQRLSSGLGRGLVWFFFFGKKKCLMRGVTQKIEKLVTWPK